MRKLFQLKWWQYQKRQRTWSQNALRRAEPTLQSLHCAETLEVRGLLSASGFSGLTDCLDTQLDPIDHLIHLPNGEATKPYLYVSANLLDPKILAAITALATSETGPGAAVGGLAGFVGGLVLSHFVSVEVKLTVDIEDWLSTAINGTSSYFTQDGEDGWTTLYLEISDSLGFNPLAEFSAPVDLGIDYVPSPSV